MGVFDSPEAQNWLRQWLAVFITREAILPAVKSETVRLHTYILGTLPATVCSQDHGRITDTLRLFCRFHEVFRDEIKQRHKQRPSWKNATTDTWHNDSFSIAKLFMQPSGYDDKTSFDQIDFNGIAAFMYNCGRFPATVESSSDQARVSTNKIRHMPDKCSSALTDQATTECIDNLSTLLNDPTFNTDKEVQEALKQLDELKTTFPKLFEEHWKSIIEDITTKCLQDIHDLCKDEKESWKTEADQKTADLRSLGDSILSHLATRGETVLGDIKKSIKDGMKSIEDQVVKGEGKIVEKTEKGERKIDEQTEKGVRRIEERTVSGDRKIKENTEKGERKIDENTKIGERKIAETAKTGERKIEENVEIGERKIEEKTEIGERKIVENTKIGKRIIEKKIELGKRKIEETAKIGERNIDETAKKGKRKIEEKVELGERKIDAKMKDLDAKSGKLTKADLRKELFKLYNKTASTVRIRLDIDEAVEKVYEEPKLTLKKTGKDKEDLLSEVNDIFRNNKCTMDKTIFIEGEPGSGKSSLCKMIVHEWCKTKHCGRTEHDGHELISQFEFVFHIILREAKNECHVKKMIFKNIIDRIGFDKRSSETLLREVLKSNTCLLMLDGLDEWKHPEGCHLDERIPHVETIWENCTILITTRPYKIAELKIGRSQIGKHIMLKGVSNPERLVEKVVSSLNEFYDTGLSQGPRAARLPLNHNKCVTEIRDKILWHFSECPVLLVHIVWLWYKGKLLVDMTQSELYGTLLKERWLESCGNRESAVGSKYNNVIYALSEIAFKKLFAEDEHSTIVFDIDEKKNPTFESQKYASLESGILSCSNIPGDSPQYHFLHKSVQEYLAALYLSKDFDKCCLHIKQTYKNHRKESGVSLSKVLLFLCGLNSKAAEELAETINELFTDFCDNYGYSERESRNIQDLIIEGQIELDRSDNSGRKLCLEHLCIAENDFDNETITVKNAAALQKYKTTNQSSIVSLYIFPNVFGAYGGVLDLENYKCLKYLYAFLIGFNDVTGLNLSNLEECYIKFDRTQNAPNLTSTFYNTDITCLKKMKKLHLSKLADFNWLREGSEREGILDIRRLANLEQLTDLGLEILPHSDVMNLQELRIHKLLIGFQVLERAPQLMSAFSAYGPCQNERTGLFSHLKDVRLERIHMVEKQFRRLLQSFIKARGTSLQLVGCSIEPEDDVPQFQNGYEQQVVSSECTTYIGFWYLTITIEGFMWLIDYVTRCGQSVKCELDATYLKLNYPVEKPAFPMSVPQLILANYTTELKLSCTDISTEQICQIFGRINQLNHSVTLTLDCCTELSGKINSLGNQMVPPPNPSQDCTKYIEIKNMNISETLFWYADISAIHLGYTCKISRCNILPSEVPHADNLHFPKMTANHSPAQTAKLRFDRASIPQHVVERLACQAALSGHLVEFVLDMCYVGVTPADVLSLKEKLEGDPAIQIEKFKFETSKGIPNICLERYKPGQAWDIRFNTNAKI